MFQQVTRAERIFSIVHPVFRDDDRDAKTLPPAYGFCQPRGDVGNEACVAQGRILREGPAGVQLLSSQQVKPDLFGSVIINAQEVLGACSPRQFFPLENSIEAPLCHRPGEQVIEQGMVKVGRPAVHGQPGGRFEAPVVQRRPHPGLRLQVVDDAVSSCMRQHHVAHHAQRG